MSKLKRFQLSLFWDSVERRILPALTSLYIMVVLLIIAVNIISAINWLNAPFIGGFLEHTLIFSSLKPTRASSWNAVIAGLDFGNQLVAIEGSKIEDVRQLPRTLTRYDLGDKIKLEVQDIRGEYTSVEVVLDTFKNPDRIIFFFIPLVIGLLYLGSGLVVNSVNPEATYSKAYVIFSGSAAVVMAGWFDSNTSNYMTKLWTIGLALVGAALLHLALVFPKRARLVRRVPFLGWVGYGLALVLIVNTLPTIYNLQVPLAYVPLWRQAYFLLGIAVVVFIAWMALRQLISPTSLDAVQGLIIPWGAMLSFAPIMIWFVINTIRPEILFSPYLLMPLVLFPLAFSYVTLRGRSYSTRHIFKRTLIYVLLGVMVIGAYATLVSGASLILRERVSADNPYLFGLIIFILAILFSPIRSRLREKIDWLFMRGQRVYQIQSEAFSHQLSKAMEQNDIVNLTRQYVEESFSPSGLHIYIRNAFRDHFEAADGVDGRPTSDMRFASNSVLPRMLADQRSALILSDNGDIPQGLEPERGRLALLGAKLYMPLSIRDDSLIGWLALGPQMSGEAYSSTQLKYLRAFCDHVTQAIERVQVVTDLERRIQELNVLSRLSQGINITLNFDDILELIYTQTTHLISASDFKITLYDQVGEYYYHVFYLEDDKRLNDREGGPLRENYGLVKVVHQDGRWIVTDDYARECRSRGILPEDEGVYAWIGIPLSAGDENIGVLSLASRNPADFFTDEQVRLLQAIADLAAGAIIKARLLEESERRSRQMEMLNDLGRSLTSTLDVSPLMNQILESAVDILNAESGALFMINEESGDLIFKAVTDPISRRLVGRRLPQGTGYVGEVAKSGQPVIINDAPKPEDWVTTIEDDLIFETKDLLLVPMQVKDRITGMIEIINKRDGSPFTIGDQELLTAFTGQAAVALENARLYTLTDQKLADRVDELFVMQRIDRELNDRLDVDRAMHITLDWAMNQSDADAGLVGMLEDGKVRVMASQGYDSELDAYPDSLLPLNSPALRNAIYQEVTQQLDVSRNGDGFGLLTNATSQVVIPIRREDKVIGILMLETRRTNPWGEDIQAFLSRLSDHAAIAIANARLYAEVQEANLAKTEFVSLVSHELKTPMTSIKGYTDLLLGGAVGTVSEAQANFLHTIRTNVNRMDDLVSDLADVSRIEAGRLRLDFEAVAVEDVMEDVLHTTQRELESKNLDLEVRVPDDLPRVWGDRTRLVQVLTNLLSNAYKYTQNGGSITMQARQTPNQWDPNGAPEVVHISISDTGIGIKSEEQVHIFQKFFRCEDPRVREVPGTGLGLNITKYLVEMQGGKIWFESELDQGTTFHITVPVSET